MSDRVMVISPAPTANGDLHLGHIGGPFLAADVYRRYQRALGREVSLGTGFQDTSTYVVTTANRLGMTPKSLVARSAAQIEATLTTMGIDVDGFTGDDGRFVKGVLDFLERLHAAGKFRLRTMLFPYSPCTGEYLVDGHVRGGCPFCLADGNGGLCESCGHPIAPGELVDPRSVIHPDEPVEMREATVLVLPMEDYRDQLREYYASHTWAIRPHMAQLIEEILARPLRDYPITYPISSWGIPAPFPEVAGQVINPNAETMGWSIHCTALSAERSGAAPAAEDQLWLADAGTRVVYFLGFDNTYPFAVVGLTMLLASDGRYLLPDAFVTNEFYELDNEKFSTSRGHVVWGTDLAAQTPRDLIRFHLAATSPEHQRTDFSRAALARVTESRLVRPWNRIAARVDEWVGGGPRPVSDRSRVAATRIVARFAACYELAGFSLNRAAQTLTEQLLRLDQWAAHPDAAGDFCHQVEVVLRCAAPILIDLAGQTLTDPAISGCESATSITPGRLSRLTRESG
jgi:methionyl-tRNA synthetase